MSEQGVVSGAIVPWLHASWDRAGIEGQAIARLFVVFLFVAIVIWLAVAAITVFVALRRERAPRHPLDLEPTAERSATRIVASCTIATIAIVLALSALSYMAQRVVFAKPAADVTIRITGHQWWWEVEYLGSDGPSFATANEIRIPVQKPVRVLLETADVIHSFWAPSLTGKMDQINGQTNELQFTARHVGVYRGQCAEFCGLQHAHMGFEIIAAEPDEFQQWRQGQAQFAASSPQAAEGEAVFMRACARCHTIRGTPAAAKSGPDLTHLASRRMIAAARLPRNVGNLSAWIADPQHIKPGNGMPAVPLEGPELIALVAYLEQLK